MPDIVKIRSLPSASDLSDGDYAAIDNSTDGLRKVALGGIISDLKSDLLQLTPWSRYSDVYDTFGNLYKDSYNKITDRYDTIKSVIIPLVSGYTYSFKAIGAFNRFGLYGCDGNQIGDTVYPAICFYEGALTNKEYTYSNQDGYPYLLVLLAFSYDAFTCELEVIREHGTVGDIFSVNGVQVPTKEQEEADISNSVNGITTRKESEKFDGSFVNFWKNSSDKLAVNSNCQSVIIPIIDGATYKINVNGKFNRFALYGCDGCVVGSSATTIIFSEGAFTDKSYEYVCNGEYSYMLLLLAYSYSQFSVTVSIREIIGDTSEAFRVNGIEVVTVDQLSELEGTVDALGQTVAGISSDVDTIYDSIENYIPKFEMNGLDSGSGSDFASQARIRTVGYIDQSITYVSAATGYYIILYAYNLDGTYKGVWDAPNNKFIKNIVTLTFVDITTIPSYQAYRYRVVLRRTDNGNMTVSEAENASFSPCNKMEKLEEEYENLIENLDALVPGYKSTSYYSADDTQLFVPTYSGLIALYDALVTAYPEYITKNTLTIGSFSNYEYVFSMGSRNNGNGKRKEDAEIEKPLVLIMSGVHGYERCSVMGLYLFAKALCDDPTLSSLRSGLVIKMLPIVCPYGYDNNSRTNSNGVNINRNFDADWVQTSTGQDYSGAAPADQEETQVAQAWIDANTDAVLAIDWHNSGYTNEISYMSTNSKTGFAPSIKKAYFFGVDHIIGRWAVERNITGNDVIYGYTGYECDGGHSETYCAKKGIDACLVETSWNVGNYGKDSARTIGVNAEAFCAIMRGIMEKYIDDL